MVLCCSSYASKPDNPVRGKPGGSDGGTSVSQLVDLHPADSGYSRAYAISETGIVVGTVDDVAGVWNATDATPTFSALPGSAWAANAINPSGEIVGSGPNATYWASPGADPIALPLPPGSLSGSANGISLDGVVVGSVYDGQEDSVVAWRVNEGSVFGPVVLSTGRAYDVATTGAVSNRIVGSSAVGSVGSAGATAWDLELLPDGSFAVAGSAILVPGETSQAYAITERGDVSGIVYGFDKLHTPYDQAFVIRDGLLDLLPSGSNNHYGVGFDLNDTNVVGATARYWNSKVGNATRWNADGKAVDLMRGYFDDNWSSAMADGINGRGDIVGYGNRGEEGHAWLLRQPLTTLSLSSAVPEPSAATILLVELSAALGLFCRQKQRRC